MYTSTEINPMTKIFLSAGEASGDLHGANLIQKLSALRSNIQFSGMGGPKMQAAGCDILVDCQPISVIGLVEIITHFPAIYSAMKTMQKGLREQKPDLLILIDYSGFNLRLAKYAKKQGIKTLYFISPHVWAWRKGRIKTIRQYIDHMAVIFPFEKTFYEQKNIPVTYVGNSLVDKVKTNLSADEVYEQFQLPRDKTLIALVPGSRKSEINRIFPTILQTAALLQQQHSNLHFVIPLAATLTEQDIAPYLTNNLLPISIIPQQLYNLLPLCQAAIVVSGTVTLEIALLGTPMVIIYKLSPITFNLVRHIIKFEHMGMCNLIAEQRVAPELIQFQATPENIASEINKILQNDVYRQEMKNKLALIKHKCVRADKDVAEVVISLLDK